MKRFMILIFALAATFACAKTPEEQPAEKELTAPQGLEVHSHSETGLAFQWDAVDGAEGYDYELTKGNEIIQNASTTKRNVVFSNLNAGTSYTFSVCSKKGDKKSAYSTIEAKTDGGTAEEEDDPQKEDPQKEDPQGIYETVGIPQCEEEDGLARAFPGAEGGGMYATGGRGGAVYHVTSLSDDGSEGTLRWAVSKSGARTIVFDVAGTIELKQDLKISRGDVTIAGQTAPGDGICLKNYSTVVAADNVIIRFLRFRLGDEAPWTESEISAGKPDSEDALQGKNQKKIILDHCSMSWSIDECASFYGNTDFTMQWCTISESMRSCKLHSKGNHGYGGIWGGDNASFHHNLISNHDSRNPRFDHDYVSTIKGPVHFINNVIYNWGGNSGYGGESAKGSSPRQINMVANYYKPGPSSSNRTRIVNPTTKCSNCNSSSPTDIVPGLFYITDNFMYGSDKVTADNWEGVHPDDKSKKDELKSSSYMGSHTGTMHSAQDAMEKVIAYAGASLSRDDVDKRICSQVNDDTGSLINDMAQVGEKYGFTWPEYKADSTPKDTDKDGIPDSYEDILGLDKNDAKDAAGYTIDTKKRYTNLEIYLHYLVKDIIKAQNEKGNYTTTNN